MTPGQHPPPPPPQPAQISQEQMILVQAKQNVFLLEPRLQTTRECIQLIEDAASSGTHLLSEGKGVEAVLMLVEAMAKAQLIQLNAALIEGETSLSKSKDVIQQIESKVKLFRPAGSFPQGAA